jgi:hypothetical protein
LIAELDEVSFAGDKMPIHTERAKPMLRVW